MRRVTKTVFVFAALLALLVFERPAMAASTSTGCLPGSLKSTLAQLTRNFGPLRIVSTHRPGARIAGSGRRSFHASCRAVDFHPPAGKYGQVMAWLRRNHSGGLGTYSGGMNHIHIDNGPRIAFHHGGGRRYAAKSSRGGRSRVAASVQRATTRIARASQDVKIVGSQS